MSVNQGVTEKLKSRLRESIPKGLGLTGMGEGAVLVRGRT